MHVSLTAEQAKQLLDQGYFAQLNPESGYFFGADVATNGSLAGYRQPDGSWHVTGLYEVEQELIKVVESLPQALLVVE